MTTPTTSRKTPDAAAIRNATVPVDALRPHPRNYRKHPDLQIGRLEASLARFSQVRSIVVQEGAGGRYLIVAGHGLVEAAKRQGLTDLRADVIPASWTPAQVEGYLVADNELGRGAEDDALLLAEILKEQDNAGYDLASLGSSAEELDALLEELAQQRLGPQHAVDDPSGGGDDFDTTPSEGETRVQPGDLWACGDHRLLCGDSTRREDVARLMGNTEADVVFTDPPYGVDYTGGTKPQPRLVGDHMETSIYHDALPVMSSVMSDRAALYLCFAARSAKHVFDAVDMAGFEIRALLIWNKNHAQFGAMGAHYKQKHEPMLYCARRGGSLDWYGPNNEVTVWDVDRSAANDFHPTQKPIVLVARALENSSAEGDVVLDTFLGGGSTLIAAERLGRCCYGLEIEPRYCDVVLRRWETETGREATLLERVTEHESLAAAAVEA